MHHGAAQGHGARKRAHQRHLHFLDDRYDGVGGGRTHVAEQGEYLFFLDQPERFADGPVRVVAIVGDHQLDAAAMDAAALVCFLENGRRAIEHGPSQPGGRPGLGIDHAEPDVRIGHARFGGMADAGREADGEPAAWRKKAREKAHELPLLRLTGINRYGLDNEYGGNCQRKTHT